MKRYVVTGGAGFIGSCFIRKLFEWESAARVVNFDKMTYAGDRSRLGALEKDGRYEFVQGDVADPRSLLPVLRGADAVFHFAAETHVDRSLLDARAFFATNASGVQTLLDCMKEVSAGRLVHVSTDEVYGSRDEGFFKETDPVGPTNPYSVSKAAAEWLVLNAVRQDGVDAVITRGSNTYGPYQYPEKVIPLFVSNLIRGQKVPLYGDGSNERDWLHVEDHCEAVIRVFRQGARGEIYNVAGSGRLSNLDLTRRLLNLLGRNESFIDYVPDRKGHDWRYALDDAKLRALGWKPGRDFDGVFAEVIAWYREHQSWLEAIRARRGEFEAYYRAQYKNRKESGG